MRRLRLFASLLVVASATPRAGNPYYYAHWCGQEKYALTLLDDRECQKIFPSNASRAMTCAASDALSEEQLLARGYAREAPLPDVVVDEAVLAARAPATRDVSVCVVLVERATGGDAWYRYLCGEGDAARAAETWSSSKMFAAANAGGRLRDVAARRPGEEVASPMSLRAGDKGATLADMATVLASYDTTAGYTSNALGGFFNWVGWRERSLHNVVEWLWDGRDRAGQSLDGNYGEPVPADLGYDPVVLSRDDAATGLAVKADPSAAVVPNTLTPLSAVEMMRRIAMCERLGRKELRFPNTTCADARAMLYGPELLPGSALATARARSSSALFPPSTVFGGLSADTAIYTQVAALDAIDRAGAALDDGAFRIFSKLGAGYSTSRRVGEVLSTAYACLPVRGGDASVRGLELLLSVRASVPHDVALRRADELVGAAVHDIVAAAMRGELDGGGTRGPAKTQHAPVD